MFAVCSEYNYVRMWNLTQFHGIISTQPGSMPLASFKVNSLENVEPHLQCIHGNDFGKSYLQYLELQELDI